MMDIVIIPCFDRPEYLQICLDNIQKADNSEKLLYYFCLDSGFHPDNLKVIKRFPYKNRVIKRKKVFYSLTKQSFNLLAGYKEASEVAGKYVFLIEDDIMIGKDFFNWHYKVQNKEKLFCSIGSRNNCTNFKTENNPEYYYFGAKSDYQSLGVCWRKEVLINHVLPHFTSAYLSNPIGYCLKTFSTSIIGKFFAEQDGLIRRIKETLNLPIAFPHVPRCYHAGFYSFNRNKHHKLKGNIEDKIFMLRKIINNVDLYKKYCYEEGFFKDSMPIDLTIINNKPLKNVKGQR